MNGNIQLMILQILLREQSTTQMKIAEEVGVSVRTVSRHLDQLTVNGVPITTKTGKNGGIYIDKQYKFNSQFLNDEDIKTLFALMEVGENILEMGYKERLREKIIFLNPKANKLIEHATKDFFCVDMKNSPIVAGHEQVRFIREALLRECEIEITLHEQKLKVFPISCVLKEDGLFVYVKAESEYLLVLINSIKRIKLCLEQPGIKRSECILYRKGMEIKRMY